MYRSLIATFGATPDGVIRRPNPSPQRESTLTTSSGNPSPSPAHQCGSRFTALLQSGSAVNLHVPSSLMANGKPAEQAPCQTGKGKKTSIFNPLIAELTPPQMAFGTAVCPASLQYAHDLCTASILIKRWWR
jgi:hypothetical protein